MPEVLETRKISAISTSLLSHCGKVMTSIILQIIRPITYLTLALQNNEFGAKVSGFCRPYI